jgi:hypothetical protein
MPLGGPQLSAADLAKIRRWIELGTPAEEGAPQVRGRSGSGVRYRRSRSEEILCALGFFSCLEREWWHRIIWHCATTGACRWCSSLIRGKPKAECCSLTCRYRGQKRRLRQQMKEAKALRAEGKTVKQIAAALDQGGR